MSQQRVLPYIILGMLANEDNLTGRQITELFETEIGNFWKAAHSQVYPELKRMVKEQWVTVHDRPTNAKERYYKITSLGQDHLNQWISEPNDTPQQKDLFSLKMFFIKDSRDPRIPLLIEAQIDILKEQLAGFLARKSLLFDDREKIQENYGHYLILTRAIARCQGQIQWLEQSLIYIEH
ncbi:PadR family transcriptional regulator [Streptococcus moroccensis]|uniref:DNA-binding PadR family transcriptional regulator n=1 Tax=Streptococcus moroccensis TaxID=1451356 RepID=A0ABT9YSE9_9STRE|nr:PadR family transcriptional regulator [Streptococcus moroccensis]MDQ0222035.1 DNA-binding PadR family transcriptional regulator [Streptococcus moroccensis]